jgi:hypothetical protein
MKYPNSTVYKVTEKKKAEAFVNAKNDRIAAENKSSDINSIDTLYWYLREDKAKLTPESINILIENLICILLKCY